MKRRVTAKPKPLTRGQQQLVTANLGLAGKVTANFMARYPALRSQRGDIFQTACLGLVHAARLFDSGRGIRFSTYAWKAIEQTVQRVVQKEARHEKQGDLSALVLYPTLDR